MSNRVPCSDGWAERLRPAGRRQRAAFALFGGLLCGVVATLAAPRFARDLLLTRAAASDEDVPPQESDEPQSDEPHDPDAPPPEEAPPESPEEPAPEEPAPEEPAPEEPAPESPAPPDEPVPEPAGEPHEEPTVCPPESEGTPPPTDESAVDESAPSADELDAAPPPPAEDVVELDNGSRWVGRILEQTAEGVWLEMISAQGARQRTFLPQKRIAVVTRAAAPQSAATQDAVFRSEWFLLESEGRIVGWRRLETERLESARLIGWRLEEEILEFARGRHLPAVRISRVETADDAWQPRLFDFSEATERTEGGPRVTFERKVSGEVRDGRWLLFVVTDAGSERREVEVPPDAIGVLAARERLLQQQPREVGLEKITLLDASLEASQEAEMGFVSAGGGSSGDELHLVRGTTRLVGRFDGKGTTLREEIADGVVAIPSTERRCLAAERGEAPPVEEGSPLRVRLAAVGVEFELGGDTWRWKPSLDTVRTGWRPLGRVEDPAHLMDVRAEWHPSDELPSMAPDAVRVWLLKRLRDQAPDLIELPAADPLPIPGTQRLDLRCTLRQERIHTVAILIERPRGYVVLLAACPERAWPSARDGVERLLGSIRLF